MSTAQADLHPVADVSVAAPAPATVRAVALVLPGGKAASYEPADPRQLAAVRMVPFSRALHRRGAGNGLAVWTVRYRYRGWNDAAASPLIDTRWALEEVRRRHGEVPVAVVGHSMGGRTALRVAGDESVRGVVALAPWLPDGEPVEQLAGLPVLIAHGSHDVITSAAASRAYAERARAVTDRVCRLRVRADLHAMLLRARTWHRLATGFALASLGMAELPPAARRALDRAARGDFDMPI